MKSWKGLFKKEWTLLKWGIIVLALKNVFVILLGPTIINRVFGVPQDFFTTTLILVGIWLVFNIFVGAGVLITSLGREMKRPDTWLHSPASMLQLVGAKAVFAMVVTVFLLALGGLLLGVSFLTSDAIGIISISDGVLSLLLVLLAIFLNSILIMAIGFFIWSVYEVIRSHKGKTSGGMLIILSFAGAFTGLILSDKLGIGMAIASVFRSINKIGPVKVTDLAFYNEHTSYLFTSIVPVEDIIFSTGGLLVGGIVTVFLFVAGSMLFEKKVRL